MTCAHLRIQLLQPEETERVLFLCVHAAMKPNEGKGSSLTLEKFFKLRESGTTVSTEIMAGLTTFFTMAYIIAVSYTHLQLHTVQGAGDSYYGIQHVLCPQLSAA